MFSATWARTISIRPFIFCDPV
jgi:hypothetical protein